MTFDADKAAHMLYGMSEKMYDQGLRFDFNNMRWVAVDSGTAQPNYRYTVPILHADGSPWVSNTWGTLTGITDTKEPEQ